ncbi:nuclear transport factor 2 family protein [Actinophytocola sp.]|uniref:nuclear transport factor 2 family protein n=1 Tax=Actinophytocola sp. TaxID=1872138 RepID=UPI002D7EA7DD|nr:nuclear transport factor 2 family protein [Actinophytocola sp.]HET9139838.1 nuclear transport factor 2 family protein [Actinophytocola sp.]
MIDRQQQIDEYVATWNETDPDLRLAMIEKVWTEDGHYVDRGAEARGHAQISANIDRIHRKFPDRIYGRTSEIYHHRDRARFEWAIIDPAGRPTFGGVAYAKFGDDGRLRSIIGFFGQIPDAVR